MASEHRTRTLAGLGLAFALGACAAPRFPAKAPLWEDTDRTPVYVKCEVRPNDDDPKHVACSPEPYVSPLAWDAADNSIFRPLAKVFAVDPPREAPNVNAFDEVPDSAWFQNRLGKRRPVRDELLRGACTPEEMLNPEGAPGSWVIDQGKPNGATPGFRIKVAGKHKYMLKTDSLDQPERPTAASAIGAAIYHAVGFNTSCEQIVYFDRAIFTLKPGLVATDNSGVRRAFDERALENVFKQAARRGPLLRMQASAWLPGELLGPFRYEGMRTDDPNDVIPHEDRRDLRGARLVAAWLNHFDAREQNTMDSWIASNPEVKDSSPGYIRHYYLDTSDSFGSEWADDGISRRLGRSYVLDFGDIGADFVTFGGVTRSWEEAERTPGYELFGYYHFRDFDPEGWKNEYPNPAFSRATERDNAWMARILARFERSDIEALVTLGKFSRPEHAEFLTEILEQRLRKILDRYLLRLSPLADLRVEAGSRLCAKDLARARAVRPESAFRYEARLEQAHHRQPLRVAVKPAGGLCIELPRERPVSGTPIRNYTTVAVANGASSYFLRAHLYEFDHGYQLVGIERTDEEFR